MSLSKVMGLDPGYSITERVFAATIHMGAGIELAAG
jgi:hypothetical protein